MHRPPSSPPPSTPPKDAENLSTTVLANTRAAVERVSHSAEAVRQIMDLVVHYGKVEFARGELAAVSPTPKDEVQRAIRQTDLFLTFDPRTKLPDSVYKDNSILLVLKCSRRVFRVQTLRISEHARQALIVIDQLQGCGWLEEIVD